MQKKSYSSHKKPFSTTLQLDNRTYRVGPKGGVYYINSHNKKVYIKSRRIQ